MLLSWCDPKINLALVPNLASSDGSGARDFTCINFEFEVICLSIRRFGLEKDRLAQPALSRAEFFALRIRTDWNDFG